LVSLVSSVPPMSIEVFSEVLGFSHDEAALFSFIFFNPRGTSSRLEDHHLFLFSFQGVRCFIADNPSSLFPMPGGKFLEEEKKGKVKKKESRGREMTSLALHPKGSSFAQSRGLCPCESLAAATHRSGRMDFFFLGSSLEAIPILFQDSLCEARERVCDVSTSP